MIPRERENSQSFYDRIKIFPEHEIWECDFAYQDGKNYHSRQFRDSGERYFEHLRSVFLIIWDEYKLYDPSLVKAAFSHDGGEDTSMLSNPTKFLNSEFRRRATYRQTKLYNAEVAELTLAVTRPYVDGVEVKTKEQAEQMAIDNLIAASSKAKILKSADRLGNLRDIGGIKDPKRRERKFIETRDHYFPIFEMARRDYPEVIDYALDEMAKAMALHGFQI